MGRNKSRILMLYRILEKYTDETHQLSMEEILQKLYDEGFECERDAVKRDIKLLRENFGIDIIASKGRNATYFIGNRLLQNAEIKLLLDSVYASNIIPNNIAEHISKKLRSTVSIYDAETLDRSVLGINVAKSDNKRILINIHNILHAINNKKQITFEYRHWTKDKALINKSQKSYSLNPFTLIWADGRYYLYGYDTKETEGILKERVYRVDKLYNIEQLENEIRGNELFAKFNPDTYVSRRIGMFSGKEEYITVKLPEYLIGAFIDQFGTNIEIYDDSEAGYLQVSFYAVPSEMFLGWIIGLGNIRILQPDSIKNKLLELLKKNLELSQG